MWKQCPYNPRYFIILLHPASGFGSPSSVGWGRGGGGSSGLRSHIGSASGARGRERTNNRLEHVLLLAVGWNTKKQANRSPLRWGEIKTRRARMIFVHALITITTATELTRMSIITTANEHFLFQVSIVWIIQQRVFLRLKLNRGQKQFSTRASNWFQQGIGW